MGQLSCSMPVRYYVHIAAVVQQRNIIPKSWKPRYSVLSRIELYNIHIELYYLFIEVQIAILKKVVTYKQDIIPHFHNFPFQAYYRCLFCSPSSKATYVQDTLKQQFPSPNCAAADGSFGIFMHKMQLNALGFLSHVPYRSTG